ncbi:MAG: tape measure protein, partial [Solimonas sp.]
QQVARHSDSYPLFLLGALMQSFVKLKAFGLDPLDGTLSSIADITAKMGGGQEEMSGIVLALGQAWSKEKLQGEEAMQLMERGIPVWELLAKATGLSTAQLIQLSSAGRLGRDAIKALIHEMGKSSKGAAESASSTWSGMVGNLMDQWTRFRLMVMNAGLFEFMKGKLDGILAHLNEMAQNGSLQKIAEDWSRKLQGGLSGLWNMATQLAPALLKLISISDRAANALGGYDKLIYIWAGAQIVGALAGLASFAGGLLTLAAAAPAALAGLAAITAEAIAMQAALAPIIATMWGIYAVYKATRFILNKTGVQPDSDEIASTPGVELTDDSRARLADPNVQKRISKMRALKSVWTPADDAVKGSDQFIPWREIKQPAQPKEEIEGIPWREVGAPGQRAQTSEVQPSPQDVHVGGLVRIQLDGGNARVAGITKDASSAVDFSVNSGRFFYGQGAP